MIARNCSRQNLLDALELINNSEALNDKAGPIGNFKGNIRFKKLETQGKGFSFTLSVLSTHHGKGKNKIALLGVRRSASSYQSGRLISAACWHAHGRFFDALFSLAPAARVYSSWFKRSDTGKFGAWIDANGGNWQDGQIGSMAYPIMYSEACTCND